MKTKEQILKECFDGNRTSYLDIDHNTIDGDVYPVLEAMELYAQQATEEYRIRFIPDSPRVSVFQAEPGNVIVVPPEGLGVLCIVGPTKNDLSLLQTAEAMHKSCAAADKAFLESIMTGEMCVPVERDGAYLQGFEDGQKTKQVPAKSRFTLELAAKIDMPGQKFTTFPVKCIQLSGEDEIRKGDVLYCEKEEIVVEGVRGRILQCMYITNDNLSYLPPELLTSDYTWKLKV